MRTSQTYYPIKKSKSWKHLQLQGIRCIAPRLTTKDSLNIYGTSFLPMLSHEDPIFSKLVRQAHINYTPTSHPVHLSLKGTQARFLKGAFGFYTPNMTSLITQFNFTCKICNLERALNFTSPEGPKYTGIETDPHLFQHISIDYWAQ